MDKIEKELQKLTVKERKQIDQILLKLEAGVTKGFDIKKLKGYADIFRMRKGNIRIIYRTNNKGTIFILSIERRREDTYKI